jgi:hypothetical protein
MATEIVAGISLLMHRFDQRSVHVRNVVDKAAQGQVFSKYFGSSSSFSSYFLLLLLLLLLGPSS